jgi:adenylylsulfate kinase
MVLRMKINQRLLRNSSDKRILPKYDNEQALKMNEHITYYRSVVTREKREKLNGHNSVVLWFTGLPCSGKSTIAHAVEEKLHQMGCRTFVLDGDNVRHGLCSDLGFSPEDRAENIRRIGELVKLFLDAGIITLTAFVSPFRADRNRVRSLLKEGDFIEIYCKCPVEVCEQRDVKGYYKKARAGKIQDYTGVSSPYEEPESLDLVLETGKCTINNCIEKVLNFLAQKAILNKNSN